MMKSIKMPDIDRQSLDIIWMTSEISIKFSGKMWLMIILKFTKEQGFTLSLENTVLEKPLGCG